MRDTGIGIPASELQRVFDRFYRVTQGTLPDERCAGLGLSIVKSIVTAHGGRVDVESIVGQGTVFRLRLPIGTNTESSNGAR